MPGADFQARLNAALLAFGQKLTQRSGSVVVMNDEIADGLAQGFFAGPAEGTLRLFVPVGNSFVRINLEEGIECRLDDQAIPLFAALQLQCLLGKPAVYRRGQEDQPKQKDSRQG